MLHILDRNIRIKPKPEKFQDAEEKHDIIFTCEEKVYDQVVERFESGDSSHSHLAHVINIDIVRLARHRVCYSSPQNALFFTPD